MKDNITTIITLYKTPLDKLKNLNQYGSLKLLIFEQEGSESSRKYIQGILKRKFKYYYSKKNIGLTKSSNYLLKKVKTKYLLFTQADILINQNSIFKLVKIFKRNKDIIFVTPTITDKIKTKKKNDISFVKNIKAACMACDVKKLKKNKFFDEDYFLYWEDVDLIKRINDSKFKMVLANNIFAKHKGSQSSENNIKTQYLRISNYIYGELIFDLKHKKLKIIKIVRKIIKNSFLIFFNIIRFKFKDSFTSVFILYGILKFILYYLKKLI